MIALYVLLLVVWTLVCVTVGALWEAYLGEQAYRQDMDQRDKWADEMEQQMLNEGRY